jgi:hypothetical protein
MVIRAVLSSIWRENSGRTLAEQFQAPLEALIGLASADADDADGELCAEWAAELIDGLARILAVAQDAQLEGSSSAINPISLITVLDLLGRSGFLLANIRLNMRAHEQSVAEIHPILADLLQLYSSWLDHLANLTASGIIGAAPLRAMIIASGGLQRSLSSFERAEFASGQEAEAQPDQMTAMLRRLIGLTNQLEGEFTHVARDDAAT